MANISGSDINLFGASQVVSKKVCVIDVALYQFMMIGEKNVLLLNIVISFQLFRTPTFVSEPR